MGNQASTSSKRRSSRKPQTTAEQAAERAKRVVGDLQEGIKNSVKKFDDNHPAAQLLDHVCGSSYYQDDDKYRNSRSASYYSEEASEDGSRTLHSEDDTTYDGRHRSGRKSDKSVDTQSYATQSYDSDSRRRRRGASFDTEDESRLTHGDEPKLIAKPLASSFAKRCYFTKSGIGKTTQHYEGLTLTGNVVLMLASAMKLKGCPTICDEDLRRVEQTYPNQFSRLPDELLLSSGWRRISKYCHFSNKSIPDGIPFFHSKQRLHPSGGYYFLLAGSVGMIRPIDVELLTKDTLVLLETDFPNQCDATPSVLVRDPEQWVLVNKFCFFSGGPINTEEDVYYQADFDGNPIFMLAFLSPSLTPEELYKLTEIGLDNEPGLKSVVDVQEVESVYDLTERDFDDLKLYHLGPCRALPQYILQPSAWTKVLPPHFLAARQQAMLRAQEYDSRAVETVDESLKYACQSEISPETDQICTTFSKDSESIPVGHTEGVTDQNTLAPKLAIEVEGASCSNRNSFENASVVHEDFSDQVRDTNFIRDPSTPRIDPPDDEPPSLKIELVEENHNHTGTDNYLLSATGEKSPGIDSQGFFTLEPNLDNDASNNIVSHGNFPNQYIASESVSPQYCDYFEDNDVGRTAKVSGDDTHIKESKFSGSIEYFEEENSTLSCNHKENSDQDQCFPEQRIISMQQSEELIEEEESVEMKEEFDEAPFMHNNKDMTQEQISQLYPEEKKFLCESKLNGLDSYCASSNEFIENFGDDDEKDTEVEKDEINSRVSEIDNSLTKDEITNFPERLTNRFARKAIEPIDTSYTQKDTNDIDNSTPSNTSPTGISINSGIDSRSHQSPAMRGAHEILKRNRRRRLEVLAKHSNHHITSPSTIENSQHKKSDSNEKEALDDSGSDILSGSSVWTDNSGPIGDRSSRRALILQMAKARMKNNKESPAAQKGSSTIIDENDEADDTIFTEANGAHDIDLTGDLD